MHHHLNTLYQGQSLTRDAARDAARHSRDAAHALALTLESQRTQIVALSQALERMGSQRGQLDSRLGDLAAQLEAVPLGVDGDARGGQFGAQPLRICPAVGGGAHTPRGFASQ